MGRGVPIASWFVLLQRSLNLKSTFDHKNSVVVVAVVFAVMAFVYAQPACAERMRFDIPQGAARATLETFAEQAGMTVLFPSGEVGSQTTQAVSGTLEPRKAL